MPDNQALQVFYGTTPLIIVLLVISRHKHALLEEILARLDWIISGNSKK